MRTIGRRLKPAQRQARSAAPIKLGARRPARHVIADVNVRAIPFLRKPYAVIGAAELAIAGDAPKDFIRCPAASYIAKAPRREGYLECVTEYLIARVGAMLPIAIARGELAKLPAAHPLRPDVRFLSRYFLERSEQLVHGIEIVARCFGVEARDIEKEVSRDAERGFYTVDFIDDVLQDVFPDQYEQLSDALGRMIGFDALVGANDRHPMNWGVIENVIETGPVRFAPLFDTARGLFWNRDDDWLARRPPTPAARRDLLETYANGSRPLIGMPRPVPAGRKCNHFDVVEYVFSGDRVSLQAAICSVVRAFQPDRMSLMLHREFGVILSRRRLEVIDELLRYRHQRLKDLSWRP